VILDAVGTDTDIGFSIVAKGAGSVLFSTGGGSAQFQVLHTASVTRFITVTGSNGGNPTIAVAGGGSLAITPAVVVASATASTSPTTGSGIFGGGIGASGDVWASGNHSVSVAAKTLLLKQGANGAVGTFVCNGVTPVTVNNTNFAITDAVIISLNTVGGTVGAAPDLKTATGATGFTVACTAADTSTYNYALIKNAA
jgi:hypothetical protein